MHSKLMFLSLVFFLVVSLSSFDAIDPVAYKNRGLTSNSTLEMQPVEATIYEEIREFKTDVFFMKGEYFVPVNARRSIKRMFKAAKKVGKIYSAKIISWADQMRPKSKIKRLSSNQLKLVEDRNDNIEAYLERLDLHMRVLKISMAERPEVMDGLLSKDDLELKKNLEIADESNVSKSIVMFILNKQRKNHQEI